jgi:Tol biopolymer transport system component
MSFEPGTRLGPYEVLAPIGDAPTERYKASDTRRNRIVALTVLPPEVSGQPDVKARLERETRTISSLNHPNIPALIDVGHQDPSTDFVVTEFVDGETLGQRLARGPLELHEALAAAIAIADSLDKAHRQGIVHGGLNPSTVMLTPGGPKLLDFGLARLTEEVMPLVSTSMATTRTSVASLADVPAASMPYLAPEQFAGGGADARSDLFAFGAILYEMVTGRRAFDEKTQALLIAAVQSVDPEPVCKVLPAAPPALDYLVMRCLNKDPRQRFQTALDLVSELQWMARGDAHVGVVVPPAVSWWRRDRVVWAALGTAAVLAAGVSAWTLPLRDAAARPDVHFVASSLPAGTTPIAVSPDGRWVVAAINGGAVYGLSLDSVTAQTLIGGEGGTPTQPFFSADSRSIAYFQDGKLKRADIGGGPPEIICDAPANVSAGTWNADGVILFPGNGVIQRVLAAGGQPTPITVLDETKQETEHLGPAFLPDGRRFLYFASSSQQAESAVYVGSLDSPERTRLFSSEAKAVYAAPGYLLFNRGDTVFAQAFDADTLTLKGEAIRVASGVPLRIAPVAGTSPGITRSANFAVSQTGVLAYRTGATSTAPATTSSEEPRSLVWIDRSGQGRAPVGTTGAYAGVDLSPDGKRFAVHRHEGAGGDNWFFDLAQGRMQKLTFDASQDNSSPVWSPDGTRIAFASRRNNKWGLYVKPVDGAAPEELILASDNVKTPTSWSPDGKQLVYGQDSGAGDVWVVSVDDKKPVALLQEPYREAHPQLSPDGKWLAYVSQQTGVPEIYVRPFQGPGGPWQVSTDGGLYPRWRRDGKELFFYLQNALIAADIRVTGSSVEPGVPRTLFNLPPPNAQFAHSDYIRFAVTADGQRFLFSLPGARGDTTSGSVADQIVSLAEQGGGTVTVAPNTTTVVLNWTQMLK